MIHYLDTNLLVAALTRELRTTAVQGWLPQHEPGSLAISDWVVAELSATFSVKLRSKQLRARQRADALCLFTAMFQESCVRLPVTADVFYGAARFADQSAACLRAGDALHLAVAAAHGLLMVTLDMGLARAATMLRTISRPMKCGDTLASYHCVTQHVRRTVRRGVDCTVTVGMVRNCAGRTRAMHRLRRKGP